MVVRQCSRWVARVFCLGVIDGLAGLRPCAAYQNPALTAATCALQVTLSLIQPEVVLAPSTGEVTKLLLRATRNLAESAKAFRRWQDGTCLECPEQ